VRGALAWTTLISVAGLSCGGRTRTPPLPKAGSDGDDGAGQLASASAQIYVGGGSDDDSGFGPDRAHPRADAYDQYGAYGGYGYGGGAYGGYLYGGYLPTAPTPTPPMPAIPYNGTGVSDGGAITGTVRWPHPPTVAATLAMPGCGDVANPTLAIGHGGGAADTVVYIARIDHGRAFPVANRTLSVGGEVERRGCAFEPTVQVATPTPGTLTVSNADAGTIVAAVASVQLTLDEGGSRLATLAPGAARIGDAAGALIPAWVMGLSHPYYTLTDADGRFRLDEVPPGTYDVVAWHAPVVVGLKDGKIVETTAAEVHHQVVVKALSPTALSVDLPPVVVAK
jgi:hypothetical protein